ncbi:competence type IV pilus major pilin ComGC [Ammoniphilus resinae]|uniref:Prepilin-type N-terminal cleavage/methylation domain-containing protein n=1 Tax=Ammoniphilus resinae TaxID=861532 RepID=A0ABS4GRG8_9BACL|nr:prepilin-type N-terminal cleavage/methylation domain-containing protein [Ammoniphilus resinae]MBP1932829.1 prepilin-type N-terminal cleavage/methylation domain-containing protein [Ammoniphilus resinae]
MKKKIMNENGFTFLEMCIVIAIIGILMMIALPDYRSAAEKAQKNSCDANRKMIEAQVESYYIDNFEYPGTDIDPEKDDVIEGLVEVNYLKSFPECPIDGKYTVNINETSGKIEVECSEHTKAEENVSG